MKSFPILFPLAAFALVPGSAIAQEQPAAQNPAGEDARIPFANYGGVWNWRAEGDRTVYFEDSHHRWYKATLVMPAHDLPFAEFVGLDTRPSGTLDKWSAIYVRGQRYPIATFERIEGEPPRRGKAKR